jgi:hypothetical protein
MYIHIIFMYVYVYINIYIYTLYIYTIHSPGILPFKPSKKTSPTATRLHRLNAGARDVVDLPRFHRCIGCIDALSATDGESAIAVEMVGR